jgi:hypothetical protein
MDFHFYLPPTLKPYTALVLFQKVAHYLQNLLLDFHFATFGGTVYDVKLLAFKNFGFLRKKKQDRLSIILPYYSFASYVRIYQEKMAAEIARMEESKGTNLPTSPRILGGLAELVDSGSVFFTSCTPEASAAAKCLATVSGFSTRVTTRFLFFGAGSELVDVC